MKIALVIAQKDLRLLVRDRGALFWACVFPLGFALLFGAIFPTDTGAKRISVAVVDDGSQAAGALAGGLEAAPGIRVSRVSREEGESLVRRGEAVAVVGATATGMELGVDPSRSAEGAWVEAALARATAADCAPPIVRRTVDGTQGPRTGFELAFPAAVLWGLIGCAGAFAAATIAERRSGTHLRLRASPAARWTLLAGKFLACLVACVVDAALLVSISHFAFDVRLDDPFGLVLAIGSCAIAFGGLTVFLGVLGRSEQAVGGASWAALLLLAMIGGAMVPLSVMPAWMQVLSDLSPVKWGVVALEGATFRALPFSGLWPACAMLVGFGCAALAAGAFLTRRLER